MSKLPETTRIARILDIVWRISNAPRYWTRKRLADEFEVSERSISSDLGIIKHRLKFQLCSARGLGYYFPTIPRLPSVSYSVPEALALILAAHASRRMAGVPYHDLATAITRLSSVIPDELRLMVERLVSEGPGEIDEHREHVLGECTRAISSGRSLDMEHESASGDGELTHRRVDPYEVISYGRSWYLIGYCHLREDVRLFKIDRVRSIVLSDVRFERRPDFDLTAYLSPSWGLMRGVEGPVEEVVLRFRPPASRWVAEERWHGTQQVAWLSDGAMEFRVTIQITPEFRRWVFHYGRDVDVIAPASLRAWVADEAAAVLRGALPARA
jgi:predicted DNA-binding transcriptional regulator YafY